MTQSPRFEPRPPEVSGPLMSWLQVAGYFVVFFAAMALGGFLFLLGGIGIILIPGSLPTWVDVAYIIAGIIGSVTIAVIAANGAFRVTAGRRPAHPGQPTQTGGGPGTRAPSLLGWIAGIVGTVLASALSAILGAVILNWLDR